MDMVQNVRTCMDMQSIYELTLTLIQYGADPNLLLSSKTTTGSAIFSNEIASYGEALCAAAAVSEENGVAAADTNNPVAGGVSNNSTGTSFRTNSRYILFYYIILITKKEFLLNDPELTFTRIIYLFYLTMKHEQLYNCLKSLHNFYMAQVPNKKTEQLISLISSLYRKPRSLKQLARISIYEAVNHKLAQNVNRLKLPSQLKDYVLSFDI